MKKKFLSTFLLSAVLVTSSVQAFASTSDSVSQHNLVQPRTNLSNNIVDSKNEPISITQDGDVITKTYSSISPIQFETYDVAKGTIKFEHKGKNYMFNIYNDYVGYTKPNKFDAVLYAQIKFNFLIGSGLAEDGIFGSATHSATEKYQQSRGLSVDCIIGPNTWNYLYDNR